MFVSICADSFDSEVLVEKRPVLMACIRRDYDYDEQTRVLGGVSKKYGKKLKVCLLDGDSIGAFMKFGIEGSPAFILFHDGEEKGRMLGKADTLSLSSFVVKTLLGNKQGEVDVVVVDPILSHGKSGMALIKEMKNLQPSCEVIMMSGLSPYFLTYQGQLKATPPIPL